MGLSYFETFFVRLFFDRANCQIEHRYRPYLESYLCKSWSVRIDGRYTATRISLLPFGVYVLQSKIDTDDWVNIHESRDKDTIKRMAYKHLLGYVYSRNDCQYVKL